MLKTLHIIEEINNPETWEKYEVEDIIEFLINRYDKLPIGARIYENCVSQVNDITPNNEKDIEYLSITKNDIFLVIFPEATLGAWGIFQMVMMIINITMQIVEHQAKQHEPNPIVRPELKSPNNYLNDRSNIARPGNAIPDIYGKVRSVPDLISFPFKYFQNNIEYELAYFCIGRGLYEIHDMKEALTNLENIDEIKAYVYPPNYSPNNDLTGANIIYQVGEFESHIIYNMTRSRNVNGQVVVCPNNSASIDGQEYLARSVSGSPKRYYIETVNITEETSDFRNYLKAGDSITITDSYFGFQKLNTEVFPFVLEWLEGDLDGTYIIEEVLEHRIYLEDAASVNSHWIDSWEPVEDYMNSMADLGIDTPDWTKPVTIHGDNIAKLYLNFVCLGGLWYYIINDPYLYTRHATITVECTPIDQSGDPTGTTESFEIIMQGANSLLPSCYETLEIVPTFLTDPSFEGYISIRCHVVYSELPEINNAGSSDATIRWRDLYIAENIANDNFGNVTTALILTKANEISLELVERKFNTLVTRKLPSRISGDTFTTALYSTRQIADIVSAICLDPYVGNRQKSEIDFDSIYNTCDSIQTYFGHEYSTEFNYTFDSNNLSFEEILFTIGNAAFSTFYRYGNVIKMNFDQLNENAVLLFNHRNKIPNTEARTISFGNFYENDGIELNYVNQSDETQATIYIPSDKSAINPRRINTVGIRNKLQAYFQAKREFNKLKYFNTTVQFEATQESNLLNLNDKILVSDETRNDTIDGDVIAQNGLELTLSQKINIEYDVDHSYYIFLQLYDKTIQSIEFTEGSAANKIILAEAPLLPLVLTEGYFAKTTFMISIFDNSIDEYLRRTNSFLVQEKNYKSNLTCEIIAINYNEKYYQNDQDYNNEIVDENGETIE